MKQNVSKHIKTIFEYWLSNIMYVLQKFLTGIQFRNHTSTILKEIILRKLRILKQKLKTVRKGVKNEFYR